MSSNLIIDRLSSLFNTEECRYLVQALNQDNLVWRTLKNEEILQGFINYARSDFDRWTPGYLSTYLIDREALETVNWMSQDQILTENTRSRAHQAYETLRRTRLIPETLEQAGLIALFIREHFLEQETWNGISKKLIFRNSDAPDQMYFNLFKSTFACLPSLAPKFCDFSKQLIIESDTDVRTEFIALIVHANLSSPISKSSLLERFRNIFIPIGLDSQVDCLSYVEQFGYQELLKNLAGEFLSEKKILSDFSEALEYFNKNKRKLSASKYYTYIHTLDKFAELYRYAGMTEKASDLMKLASQALEQSQSLFYHRLALSTQDAKTANEYWQKILSTAQLTDEMRIDYTEFLVSQNEIEKAKEFLSNLSDPVQKEYVSLHYPQLIMDDTLRLSKSTLLNEYISNQAHSNPTSSHLKDQVISSLTLNNNDKDYKTALNFVEKQLLIRPNDEEYLAKSIYYHQKLGQPHQAIERAELLLAINPNNPEIKTKLAKLYAETKQYQKAFDIYQLLIDNSSTPSRNELLEFASISVEAGYPEIAIPICKNFLEKDRLDGESLVILGSAYVAAGDQIAALEYMEQAASISPENPASWLSLANIWERIGEPENAIETLEKASTALPQNFEIMLTLGSSYLMNKRPSESLSVLLKCYQLKPDDINLKIALANAHFALGQINEAWQDVEDLYTQFLEKPNLALISGKVLGGLERHYDAIPLLKFAFDTIKTSDSLIALIKELLAVANSKKSSDDEIKIVLDDLSTFLPILEDFAITAQSPFTFQILIAEVKTILEKHEEAYQCYLKLLDLPESRSPQNYQRIQFGIGKNAYELKYSEISLAALQEAIISNPNDIESHHLLSEAYFQSGLSEESFRSAKTALNTFPDSAENLLWYSEFMLRNGEPQKSIQALHEGIQLAPNQREFYLALVKAHLAVGEQDNAKRVLSDLVLINEISTKEMISAAKIFFHLNSKEEASTVLNRALAEGEIPDFETLNDLATSLLSIDQAEEALLLIENNTSRFSGDIRYEILRSDILAFLGKFQDAYLTLGPVVKKIEYMPNALENFNKKRKSYEETFDYSTAGVFARSTQLEFMTGDLLPTKKHIGQALLYAPNQIEYESLASEITFSLNLSSKMLDSINNVLPDLPDFNAKERNIFNKIVCKVSQIAFMKGESSAALKFFNEYLIEQEPNAESLALKTILSEIYSDLGNQTEIFAQLEEEVEKYQNYNNRKFLSISKLMEKIWVTFSYALAAWSFKKWDKAYQLFQETVDLNYLNPIVNYSFAKFMLDYAHEIANCQALKIKSHVPKLDTSSPSYQLYFNEQLSLAGRFLDAKLIEHLQKKGLALLTETNLDNEDLEKLIKDAKDSVHLLPFISDDKIVASINKTFPDNVDIALQNAIKICSENPKESLQIMTRLIEKDPNSPKLNALMAFSSPDNPEKAIESIEKALILWPDEPEWHAFAAHNYRTQGQYEIAAKHLEQSISIDPEQAHYWQTLGEIKLDEKDLVSAKSYFSKASDIFPENPKTLIALSKINSRMGDFEASIRCLELAEKIDKDNFSYSEDIANLYLNHGEIEKAIEKAKSILLNYPESIIAKVILIKSYLKQLHLEKAKVELKSSLTLHPDSIELQLVGIEILREEKGLSIALAATIDLATKNQEDTNVLYLLASLLIESGRQDQAMEALHHSLDIDPEQARVYLLLGRLNRKNGNLDQAVAHLSKAILLDPSLADAYLELGRTYQDRREHSKAIQIYKSALEIIQNNPDLYHQAGIVYKESRDFRNAEVMLRHAASLRPDDVGIRRQLASVVTLNLVHNIQEASQR